jgi:hypothetical protein
MRIGDLVTITTSRLDEKTGGHRKDYGIVTYTFPEWWRESATVEFLELGEQKIPRGMKLEIINENR